jgi:hypothetical protein
MLLLKKSVPSSNIPYRSVELLVPYQGAGRSLSPTKSLLDNLGPVLSPPKDLRENVDRPNRITVSEAEGRKERRDHDEGEAIYIVI